MGTELARHRTTQLVCAPNSAFTLQICTARSSSENMASLLLLLCYVHRPRHNCPGGTPKLYAASVTFLGGRRSRRFLQCRPLRLVPCCWPRSAGAMHACNYDMYKPEDCCAITEHTSRKLRSLPYEAWWYTPRPNANLLPVAGAQVHFPGP
jgi:hypothetical protein